MLSTTISNPQPRRKSAALEHMLNSLETSGDLLSGSECSSPATSPIEDVFTLNGTQSSKQQHGSNEKSRLGLRSPPDPVDIVWEFLNHTSEPHVAKGFIAEDAKVECHSVMIRDENNKEETSRAVQDDLDGLLARCSHCEIEIDGIFACGEDVAAFGRLAYSDGPSSIPRNVYFSIWACVDVARKKIVGVRWLDHIARAEDDREDRRV